MTSLVLVTVMTTFCSVVAAAQEPATLATTLRLQAKECDSLSKDLRESGDRLVTLAKSLTPKYQNIVTNINTDNVDTVIRRLFGKTEALENKPGKTRREDLGAIPDDLKFLGEYLISFADQIQELKQTLLKTADAVSDENKIEIPEGLQPMARGLDLDNHIIRSWSAYLELFRNKVKFLYHKLKAIEISIDQHNKLESENNELISILDLMFNLPSRLKKLDEPISKAMAPSSEILAARFAAKKKINVRLTMAFLSCARGTESTPDDIYILVAGKTSQGRVIETRVPRGTWEMKGNAKFENIMNHEIQFLAGSVEANHILWDGELNNNESVMLTMFVMEEDRQGDPAGLVHEAAESTKVGNHIGPGDTSEAVDKLLKTHIFSKGSGIFRDTDDCPGVVAVRITNDGGVPTIVWAALPRAKDVGDLPRKIHRFLLTGDDSEYSLDLKVE